MKNKTVSDLQAQMGRIYELNRLRTVKMLEAVPARDTSTILREHFRRLRRFNQLDLEIYSAIKEGKSWGQIVQRKKSQL